MRNSTRFSRTHASDHVCPALAWAERNLTEMARFTARRMNGGEADHVHLSAVFGLLKARQKIRAALSEAAELEAVR